MTRIVRAFVHENIFQFVHLMELPIQIIAFTNAKSKKIKIFLLNFPVIVTNRTKSDLAN